MISSAPWAVTVKTLIHQALSFAGLELQRSATTGRRSLHRALRIGRSHIKDAKRILGPGVRCVFDVGANVGQTAITFARAFPNAIIFSFEPDPDTYTTLCRRLAAYSRVKTVPLGLGDRQGDETLHVNRSSETNSFLKPLPDAAEYLVEPDVLRSVTSRRVSMTTLDEFCAERSLDHIDLLKLDVQGYELKVLDGASRLLAKRAVPLIYLEVSFVSTYENQPLFPDVYRYLFDRGYRFVGLYESGHGTHYYHVGGNALFMQEELGRRKKE